MQPNITKVNTNPIPQVECDNPSSLLQVFAEKRSPMIIRGFLDKWPAFNRWKPDHFKARYGNLQFVPSVDLPQQGAPFDSIWRDHHRAMALGEFVEYMQVAEKPCYIHRQSIDKFPGAVNDLSFEEIFQGKSSSSGTWMWVGSAGTRTGLHFDFQDTMLCQFFGRKQITLVSPKDSRRTYPYHDSITKSRVVPEDPDLEKYPEFAEAAIYAGIIGPGEMLFIPKHWWHSVVSLEPSISVSHNYGDKLSIMDFMHAINAAGVFGWLAVARDFTWYGVFRQSFKTKLFDDPPFGKMLYDMVTYAIKRRISV